MMKQQAAGNSTRNRVKRGSSSRPWSQSSNSHATIILAGSFIALSTAFPLSALMHRTALEKEVAGSLAQHQMEYFLANPGPFVGVTGTTTDFINAAEFPTGFSGDFSANAFGGVVGLTQIVVSVTPPHGQKVEISAIDTTYSNLVP